MGECHSLWSEVSMNTQFDVSPFSTPSIEPPKEQSSSGEAVHLLRQVVEMQREQIMLLRAIAVAHDAGARWRTFLGRWRDDFPDLSDGSRDAIQILERSYAAMMAELVEHLRQNGSGALDTDFSMQEFLDRYGMRLAQLGTILNLIGPLAEASAQGESS
jgi:hypothetical protein